MNGYLKRAITDYIISRQAEDVTIHQSAAELGLSANVLGRWVRHAKRRIAGGKRPFERHRSAHPVRPEPPPEQPPATAPTPSVDTPPKRRHTHAEVVLVVRCTQVQIDAVAKERVRALLDP